MPGQPLFRLFRRLLAMIALLSASAAALADDRQYTAVAPDGVTLAIQESGDPAGPAIVFVHGLLGSRLSWEAQLSSPLLQRYRLIAYDLRGHGQSGKPTAPQTYTDGRRWADDLAAVIAASGARQPVLVGWSLGAAVTTNYLAAYGDGDVAGAVYVGGVIELDASQIAPHPEVYRGMASTDLKTHLDAERAFLALCFETQPDTATFERLLANAALASPGMQAAVPRMTIAARQGLGAMRKPLWLIYGARDALVRAEPSLERARQLNPRVRGSVYAASGHAPFVEEAERFNRDLAAFVDAAAGR
ncbi:alpha/beta fold hydrolase [Achromobacter xylosoxidans]|uniref:alpha/beta fold hydrolase n=1 Tax=Alcaligenes xylosoxydans xylosoxydans TaxID=85698 RepID=UPI0012A8B4FF|nr:alpha/beta hydrolase [Achromobacter xylosoxidans]CUR79083.1 AB hydrolase superfamily protein YdjP [Achromobacter xylosoxidans]